MAVGAGQPHFEFRLGWSGLIAQAAESMGARLVIDELSRIASDGRLPSAAHIVAFCAIYAASTMAQTGVSGLVVVDGESFLDALFASAGQG